MASRLKYTMFELPTTVPNSLFSKMMITICEKFGTRGTEVEVGTMVEVGAGVSLGTATGGRVGGKIVGADSTNAGWQAQARKEAMIVI